jgi:hypothetical protein
VFVKVGDMLTIRWEPHIYPDQRQWASKRMMATVVRLAMERRLANTSQQHSLKL